MLEKFRKLLIKWNALQVIATFLYLYITYGLAEPFMFGNCGKDIPTEIAVAILAMLAVSYKTLPTIFQSTKKRRSSDEQTQKDRPDYPDGR